MIYHLVMALNSKSRENQKQIQKKNRKINFIKNIGNINSNTEISMKKKPLIMNKKN